MSFKYLEELTFADVAFEATGKTLEELFQASALAVFNTMCELDSIEVKEEYVLDLENADIEHLLFDFLADIVFLKDAKNMIFKKADITIKKEGKYHVLVAKMFGEKINPSRHKLHNDVKAITMHEFGIEKTQSGWRSTVVVDI